MIRPSMLFVLSAIAAAGLSAKATPASEKSRFQIVRSHADGVSPVRLVFNDGREAELRVQHSDVGWVTASMQMTETLCVKNPQPTSCHFTFPIRNFLYDMLWTKNPDASQIGQVVKKSTTGGDRIITTENLVLEQEYTVSIEESQRVGRSTLDQKAIISCDHYNWLTGRTDDATPKWAMIDSWGSEINIRNDEDDANENQTLGGGFQIQMTAMFGSYYQIDQAQFFDIFPLPGLFSVGPVALVTRDSENQLCQSTFSMDFSELRKVAAKLSPSLNQSPYEARRIPDAVLANSMGDLVRMQQALESGAEYYGVIP